MRQAPPTAAESTTAMKSMLHGDPSIALAKLWSQKESVVIKALGKPLKRGNGYLIFGPLKGFQRVMFTFDDSNLGDKSYKNVVMQFDGVLAPHVSAKEAPDFVGIRSVRESTEGGPPTDTLGVKEFDEVMGFDTAWPFDDRMKAQGLRLSLFQVDKVVTPPSRNPLGLKVGEQILSLWSD